jgi:hypothetical protein
MSNLALGNAFSHRSHGITEQMRGENRRLSHLPAHRGISPRLRYRLTADPSGLRRTLNGVATERPERNRFLCR